MIEARLDWLGKGLAFEGRTDRATVRLGSARDGEANAFGPKELVAVGLGGCTGMDVVSILEKMRAVPESFRVEVHGEAAEKHPQRFERIRVSYVVVGSATPEQVRRAVELSLTRYCGVAATLAGVAEIVPEITLNGTPVEAPIVRAFPDAGPAWAEADRTATASS